MARFASALVVVAVLSLPARNVAQAQLGGLIKKKVTEAIKGPEKKPDQQPGNAGSSSGNSAPGMGNDVIEISEPVFAGIIRGLETELRLQGEFRQELAKYPTQEQYNQCMMKAAQDPEYMKIVERAGKAGENATPEQAMAVQQKMQSEIEALANKTCPQKPVDTVWPNGRKSEKLAEIHQKAAEAAGVESSANRSDGNGRVVSLLYTYDVQPSVASALLTEIQYSIAIERIDRLCDYLNGPAGVGVVPDTAQQRDTTQRRMLIRGTGVKIFWIFTARETRVVNAANCRKFKDLTKRLM